MSLKHVLVKTVAIMVIVFMLFGNILFTGTELGKVIAQNLQAPDILIDLQTQKYVQYNKENYRGAILQDKITISKQDTAETYLPVENVEITIQVPQIKEILPSKVNVIKSSTIATNGNEQGEISQNYDINTGLLTISYGKIGDSYPEYKENSKDEFEIIYIYPQESYVENSEITVDREVKVKINYKSENEMITAEKEQGFSTMQTENIGDITNYELISSSEIYKGYMYANEENKTSYETNYTINSNLSVLNAEIVDEIKIELGKSDFISQTEENSVPADTIQYNASTITEQDFNKLFGQDGYIDFYVGEEKYATIQYIQSNENENKTYTTVYYTQQKENTEAGKVEYPGGTMEVIIVTSKPQTEGNITIHNEKKISAGEEMNLANLAVSDIKAISEKNKLEASKKEIIEQDKKDENGEVLLDENGNPQKEQVTQIIKINEKENEENIDLKEPQTQMSLELNNNNLSTLATNKITATIKLNDTNPSCELFESGNMEITLPSNLTNAKIVNAKALYTNGLNITNAKIEDGKIMITVEGKQTNYDTENISGGVNIVLDLELDIKNTTPTHQETMELTYNNKKETTTVNIVSKAGLLMLSEITGYDNNNSKNVSFDSNIQKVEIEAEGNAKELTQSISLVNNYDQKIEQVQMIGRVGYINEDYTSTFDTALSKPIQVSQANAKVYYSNNKNATYDDASWQETYSEEAKSYKIVFNQNELEKMEQVEAKVFLSVPMNIGYNQNTYIRTEMNYVYNEQKENSIATMEIATQSQELEKNIVKIQENIVTEQGDIIPITLAISPIISENVVHSKQLVTYQITVENHSDMDLRNIRLEAIIPENAIYTYQEEKDDDIVSYLETIQDAQTKLKTWEIENLKANTIEKYEILLTMSDVNQTQDVINKVNLIVEDQTISAESKLILQPASITTTLTTSEEGVIGITYDKNSPVEYYVKVKNITSEEINDIKVNYTIPQYLEYTEGGIGILEPYTGYQITEQGQCNQGVFEYTIEQLQPDEEATLVIRCRVKQLEESYEETVTSIANIYLGNDIYQTNIAKIEIVQAAFEMFLKVDTYGKEILSKEDTVSYTIQVKNVGKRSAMVTVKDIIPDEIEVSQVDYNIDGENPHTMVTSKQDISLSKSLQAGETLNIVITGTIREVEVSEETEIMVENVATIERGEDIITSNIETFRMKPEWENEDNVDQNPDVSNPGDEENPSEEPEEPQEQRTYEINGIAWLDSNKDGKRDEEETLISNVNVSLIDAITGEIVKDENGEDKKAITSEDGSYRFTNISQGTYLVIFEFDTNRYTVTTYQKTGIYPTENSDVIINQIIIDGQQKLVAITDNLEISDENKNNIDIGLIENAIFDLSIDKQISSIEVVNSQGTETTEYENENFAKVDLVAKYMNETNVIITYKFIITNNGDVTGYVDRLVDNLPSGLEFSSELNKDWYKESDGNLYTTSMKGIAIKPGETSEIELILTKKTTENTTGTFSNNAELSEISNLEAVEEIETAKENNQSSADLVISIKTGSAIMYTGITVVCIAIIAVGAYIIKKKILNKEI